MTRETALKLEEAERDYCDARREQVSLAPGELADDLRKLNAAGSRIRTLVRDLAGLRSTADHDHADDWMADMIGQIVDQLTFECAEAESVVRAAARHDPCAEVRERLRGLPRLRTINAQVRQLSDPDLMAALAGERL